MTRDEIFNRWGVTTNNVVHEDLIDGERFIMCQDKHSVVFAMPAHFSAGDALRMLHYGQKSRDNGRRDALAEERDRIKEVLGL